MLKRLKRLVQRTWEGLREPREVWASWSGCGGVTHINFPASQTIAPSDEAARIWNNLHTGDPLQVEASAIKLVAFMLKAKFNAAEWPIYGLAVDGLNGDLMLELLPNFNMPARKIYIQFGKLAGEGILRKLEPGPVSALEIWLSSDRRLSPIDPSAFRQSHMIELNDHAGYRTAVIDTLARRGYDVTARRGEFFSSLPGFQVATSPWTMLSAS